MSSDLDERHLRRSLEDGVGRPLSDNEWATFVRYLRRGPEASVTRDSKARWRWPLRHRLGYVAVVGFGLAGTALLAGWEFVFSPLFRIPIGIIVSVSAVVLILMWIWGLGRPWSAGMEGCLVWAMYAWAAVVMGSGALVSGIALAFASRRYLTADRDIAMYFQATVLDFVGWTIIAIGVLFAFSFAPRRNNGARGM